MSSEWGYRVKWYLRKCLLNTPLGALATRIRGQTGQQDWHRNKAYWDTQLSGKLARYLDGDLDVCLRAHFVADIIRKIYPATSSLLDIGCAAGDLCHAFGNGPLHIYRGIDISSVAVGAAREKNRSQITRFDAAFEASDLCAYEPDKSILWDSIVFAEVLYYLTLEEALAQILRYAQRVSESGHICVSMKNDPKSHVIFQRMLKHFHCSYSVLFQLAPGQFSSKMRLNQSNPAFLIAFLERR